MPRPDLPADLGSAFHVRRAFDAGASRSRLRARDLERPFHGVRAVHGATHVRDAADDELRVYRRSTEAKLIHERAMQYLPVMAPEAFFSHVTAAVLWDAPLPGHLLRPTRGEPPLFDPRLLEVSVPWPQRAPRGEGVIGHALRAGFATSTVHPVSGLRVANPATTWVLLGGRLRHPYDLVAVADYFIRVVRPRFSRPEDTVAPPLATIDQLAAALAAGRRHGGSRLREAIGRVRTGAASRPETWTRLTLVDAGLPEPETDHDVIDEAGRFLARVDLAYPERRIAIEYEGMHHSSGEQWETDVERYAGLEAPGWRVIRVTRAMLFQSPAVLVARVRSALHERSA